MHRLTLKNIETPQQAMRVIIALTAIATAISVLFTIVPVFWVGIPYHLPLALSIVIPIVVAPPLARVLINNSMEIAAAHREMARLSRTDPLTGVQNRRGFVETLEMAFAERAPLALLAIDIDKFKSVNDEFGHEAGDMAIAALADCLRRHCPDERIGRWAGDEFGVLALGADIEAARALANLLRADMATTPFFYHGQPIIVTLSIGLALRQNDQEDWQSLQRRADAALYSAKRMGRDCVSLEPIAA